jgi:pimeloyl-ACP methyl ester carboxylesterase
MMRKNRIFIFLVSAITLFAGDVAGEQTADSAPRTFNDLSPHKSLYVHVNGVRINYLDWGGTGHPLILIHGIGDNAHIFDDLAYLLRDQFHVFAYSRRGHGHSDAPQNGPYDLPTLVMDLKQFMDSQKIERAHLLGWSMGGNEITKFAGDYPQRVNKLLYLDSAYDWSDQPFLKTFGEILATNAPDESVLSSLEAYRDWYRPFWFGDISWTSGLESYLRDAVRISSSGRVQPIPTEKIFEPLFASLAQPPRNYSKVLAPALALYAPVFFPVEQENASRAKQINDWEQRVMVPFRRASKNRVQRELKAVTVKEIPGTCHMSIGVYKTDLLAETIRQFLSDK